MIAIPRCWRTAVLILAALPLTVACATETETETEDLKSLDNLSAGEVIQKNSCRGTYDAELMDTELQLKMSRQTTGDFTEPLTAVPTLLKEMYFGAGHRLCESTGKLCQQVGEQFDTTSCSVALRRDVLVQIGSSCEAVGEYLTNHELPEPEGEVVIYSYVAKEEKSHGTVRALAHGFSRYLLALGEDLIYGEEPEAITGLKADVIAAYRADAGVSSGPSDQDTVFAEALDSYFCYATAGLEKHPMEKDFSAVYRLMKDRVHPQLDNSENTSGTLSLFIFRLFRGAWNARSNLVNSTGGRFPRLRTGRLFPRLWGF